jgi:membrane dipeptidase
MITIFDGHNDTIHRLREFCSAGIDFLTRSNDGHLDLPRALEGGLVGGLFAMFVRPEHAPTDDLAVTTTSYEVRLADALDASYARRKTMQMLETLRSLEARADGWYVLPPAPLRSKPRDGTGRSPLCSIWKALKRSMPT